MSGLAVLSAPQMPRVACRDGPQKSAEGVSLRGPPRADTPRQDPPAFRSKPQKCRLGFSTRLKLRDVPQSAAPAFWGHRRQFLRPDQVSK
jgi:hypothetical protein